MRAQTQESLAHRIDRVLAHLAGALDQPLSLDALAEVACLSRFHFHRCYSALLGETPAETLRRLRLTRAAGELVNGRRPLREIAARAGYGSLAAFVRAFAAAYGQPPGSFRAAALPPPARRPADQPCFEIYRNDPRRTPPAELLTEVCMLLEPEGTAGGDSRSQR